MTIPATPEEDAKIIATGCTCDFSGGTRGMDRCHHCDGTGSLLRVGESYWPNTQDGFFEALAFLRQETGN